MNYPAAEQRGIKINTTTFLAAKANAKEDKDLTSEMPQPSLKINVATSSPMHLALCSKR